MEIVIVFILIWIFSPKPPPHALNWIADQLRKEYPIPCSNNLSLFPINGTLRFRIRALQVYKDGVAEEEEIPLLLFLSRSKNWAQ